MKNCRKKYKFTLIEMLAVLAIVVILLTVAVPGFMKAMQGDVNVRAGRILSSAILKARAEATVSRKTVYLIFYPTDDSLPQQYIGIKVGDEETAEWYELPKEVKLAYVSTDSCGEPNFALPNSNPWKDALDNSANFVKWKNDQFLAVNKCKYISFAKDGRMTPYNNIYFVITDKEVGDLLSAVKIELNKFTGDVKWLKQED